MSSIAKFTFSTSFAPEDILAEQDALRRQDEAPKFNEEQLEEARKQGFADGHAAGTAEVRAHIDQISAQTLQDIAGRLQELNAAHKAAVDETNREAADLAKAIAFALAPALMRQQSTAEIEALISECLTDLRDEPRVVIRSDQSVVEALKDRLDEVAANNGFTGQLVLLPDDTLTGTDCRVEWADGGASRSFDEISQQVTEAVRRYTSRIPGQNGKPAA